MHVATMKVSTLNLEVFPFRFVWCPLKPVFTISNRHTKFLGLIRSSSSGVFEFEREPTLELHDIDAALSNAEHLSKNERFATFEEICHHLKRHGCRMGHFNFGRKTAQAKQDAP